MAEYIDREKARNAVYERIDELKADKKFNLAKEICISGVKKHIQAIPTANVIEIPKGATNGDMIMALFPNAEFSNTMPFTDGRWEVMNLDTENRTREIYRPTVLRTYADWWDAPYKKEGDGNANGNN